MKNTILSILFIIFSHSIFASSLSFSELGKKEINQSFEIVLSSISKFDTDSIPPQAKEPRKQIGYLKMLLDVFIFSYPKDNSKDLLLELREVVDDGYEVFGNFKDIRDRQIAKGKKEEEIEYDTKEVAKKRKKLLVWIEELTDFVSKNEISTYLSSPLTNEFQYREKSDLPKYLWAKDPLLLPKVELSGYENLRQLFSSLFLVLEKELRVIVELESIIPHENEEKFHDFRKGLRMLNKLLTEIQGIASKDFLESMNFSRSLELVDSMGDLNDYFLVLHKLEKKKDKKKYKKLVKKVDNKWSSLRDKIINDDSFTMLKDLSETVLL